MQNNTFFNVFLYFTKSSYDSVNSVFAYDEGLASRVPYESAARTLTLSRVQFSAYATRHGLAMTMEVCLKYLYVHVLCEIASFGVQTNY